MISPELVKKFYAQLVIFFIPGLNAVKKQLREMADTVTRVEEELKRSQDAKTGALRILKFQVVALLEKTYAIDIGPGTRVLKKYENKAVSVACCGLLGASPNV